MTIFRFAVFCFSLIATDDLLAGQGSLASWNPEAISQTLIQGTSTNVSLEFVYDNTSGDIVNYLIYVQDNTACPKSVSSHSWITFNLTSGEMQPAMSGSKPVSVPLNANGLAYGTYVTNVCFVGDESSNPTNVAVRVTLKSVAEDDIFFDGLD